MFKTGERKKLINADKNPKCYRTKNSSQTDV